MKVQAHSESLARMLAPFFKGKMGEGTMSSSTRAMALLHPWETDGYWSLHDGSTYVWGKSEELFPIAKVRQASVESIQQTIGEFRSCPLRQTHPDLIASW